MVSFEERLQAAVSCYLARQKREAHPTGHWITLGDVRLWVIDPSEVRSCCRGIKTGDPREKFSGQWLQQHCRTATHVARLFQVDEKKLRAAVRDAKSPQLKLF